MQYFEIAFYDPFGKKTNNDLYINQFGKVVKFSREKGIQEFKDYTYIITKKTIEKREIKEEIIARVPQDFDIRYFLKKE